MKHQPRRNNPGKLHALLFSNSVGSLTSHIELINGEGIVVLWFIVLIREDLKG